MQHVSGVKGGIGTEMLPGQPQPRSRFRWSPPNASWAFSSPFQGCGPARPGQGSRPGGWLCGEPDATSSRTRTGRRPRWASGENQATDPGGLAAGYALAAAACERSPAMNARVSAPRTTGAKYPHLMTYICTALMRQNQMAKIQ